MNYIKEGALRYVVKKIIIGIGIGNNSSLFYNNLSELLKGSLNITTFSEDLNKYLSNSQ